MIILDVTQRTDEWFAARSLSPTSSNGDRIVTPVRGDLSKSCDGYIDELIAEHLELAEERRELNVPHVLNGTQREPLAVATYAFETGNIVEQVGMILRDDGFAGCSPDGLVTQPDGLQGGFEGKAVIAKTQISRLRAFYDGIPFTLPDANKPQVHMSLAITGLPFWDFQSYYPGLDPLVVRVTPDEYTEKVAVALDQFIEKLHRAARQFGIEINSERKAA